MDLFSRLKNFTPPERIIRSGNLYEAAVQEIEKKIQNHRDTIVTASQLLSMNRNKNSEKMITDTIKTASQIMEELNEKNRMNSKKRSFKRNTLQQQSVKSYFSVKNESEVDKNSCIGEISKFEEIKLSSPNISRHESKSKIDSNDLDDVFTRKRKLNFYSVNLCTDNSNSEGVSQYEENAKIINNCESVFEEYVADTRRKRKRVSHLNPKPTGTFTYSKKVSECFGNIDSSDITVEENVSVDSLLKRAPWIEKAAACQSTNTGNKSECSSLSNPVEECRLEDFHSNSSEFKRWNEEVSNNNKIGKNGRLLSTKEKVSIHSKEYLEKANNIFAALESNESVDYNIKCGSSCDSGFDSEISQLTSTSTKTDGSQPNQEENLENLEITTLVNRNEQKKIKRADLMKELFDEDENYTSGSKNDFKPQISSKKVIVSNQTFNFTSSASTFSKTSLANKTSHKNEERRRHLGINRHHSSAKKKISVIVEKSSPSEKINLVSKSIEEKKTKFAVRDLVMKYLDPFYKTRRITDKSIFKSAARSIVHKVMENYNSACKYTCNDVHLL